jgi:hypothetical protein
MALIVKDRVKETTTTTGTGTITLAGAVTGFQAFSVIGDGNTTYYTIAGIGSAEFEVGIGTYTLSGTTLSRDTILESSNSGSAVNFSAGTKDVFVTYPAERAVYTDAAGTAITPATASVLGVSSGGTGITSFGTGVATALGQNVSGSGSIALTTSPTFTTPVLGTPTSGTLSGCTVDGTDAVGFRNTPVNSQSADYTLLLADSGKTILHAIADDNPRTFTIPANSSVAYPVGTVVTFVNLINDVTIAITDDTMYLAGDGTTGSRTLAAFGVASAVKVASTSWIISGNGLT